MAFDVIRQVLGQVASQRLQERTKSGQLAISAQVLQNQALAQRLKQEEALFPLQMELFKRELSYLVDPMEKIKAETGQKMALALLRQQREEAVEGLRTAGRESVARIGATSREERARIAAQGRIAAAVETGKQARLTKEVPAVVEHKTAPKTPQELIDELTKGGKYTPESVEALEQAWEDTGTFDRALLKPLIKPSLSRSLTRLEANFKAAAITQRADFIEAAKAANLPMGGFLGLGGMNEEQKTQALAAMLSGSVDLNKWPELQQLVKQMAEELRLLPGKPDFF